MSRNHEHWTDSERELLETARLRGTFADLAAIALTILPRLPKPVGQVCGPISTGGLGSIEANLVRFWESSYGSRWEHAQAQRLGISLERLSPEFYLS